LGMRVSGVRRTPAAHPACEEVVGPERLHEVLAHADVVVSTVPATSETVDLFDARAFAAMKPGTTFCNVARGSVVDEDALVAALRNGHLRAAILDVVRNEPLPDDSALWSVPNLVLSPHSAVATDWHDGLFGLITENLTRWIEGRELLNVVPKEYLGRSR
jgi:phosphoglycerate dehydrogenase-like enzyme